MSLQTSNDLLYSAQSAVARHFGVRVYPVAGPPGTPGEAVAENSPTAVRMVAWCAQAVGQVPDCPDFATGANEVLVASCISLPVKGVGPDGTEYWTVAGIYYYELLLCPSDGDLVALPDSPFNTITGAVISPEQFLKGVLGYVVASTGGPWGGAGGGNFRGP